MVEQQLIDYIKKAKGAGQDDGQTRNLLYKNGWTVDEVDEAFMLLAQPQTKLQPEPAQPQPQPRPQIQTQQPRVQQPQNVYQPKVEAQPQVAIQQPEPRVQQPQPQPQPQPRPQPQPQTQQPKEMPQREMFYKNKSHTLLKLLMALIVIFILGGAGYIFAGKYINLPYTNLFWNLFAPNPQTVINNMLAIQNSAKAYHTNIQGEINNTDNNKVSLNKLVFTADGGSDLIDINNPKANFTFTFNVTSTGSTSPVASANISLISLNKSLYLKINNFTIPAEYSYPGIDISQVSGRWIKIDQDSIKSLSQAGSTETANLDISQWSKTIQDLILAENIFSDAQQLNDQIISGQDTYHYLIKVGKVKIKDFISRLTGDSGISQEMVSAFADSIINTIGDINLEIWIGKKDYMLYKYSIDKVIDVSKIQPGVNMLIEIKLNATNSNFDQPISVQAPEGAQKIEEIFAPLFKKQKIASDIMQISSGASQAFLLNKNYRTVCRNGFVNAPKGVPYSQSLVVAVKDLMAQGAKNPICFSGFQNYCVSTQLSDGTYMCVDKTGIIGTTKCVSYMTVCK